VWLGGTVSAPTGTIRTETKTKRVGVRQAIHHVTTPFRNL